MDKNKPIDQEYEMVDAADISYKVRKSLKSTDYLDESRKSFPIRPGHECTDLEASTRAWSRYKGKMSHDEFKAKVKARMKKHGCPIPESWK